MRGKRGGLGMGRGGDMTDTTNVRGVFKRVFAFTIQTLIRKIF